MFAAEFLGYTGSSLSLKLSFIILELEHPVKHQMIKCDKAQNSTIT